MPPLRVPLSRLRTSPVFTGITKGDLEAAWQYVPKIPPGARTGTVVLNISQREPFVLSAEACVDIARQFSVAATAHDTVSSVDDDHGCWRSERGVTLALYSVSKDRVGQSVWPALCSQFQLECAHVSTEGFKGCIYDWLRPSACPALVRKSCDE
jgi:hypothetical protein